MASNTFGSMRSANISFGIPLLYLSVYTSGKEIGLTIGAGGWSSALLGYILRS